MDVTLVFCTCRRIDFFLQTVDSLYENLSDIDVIERILVIDDNSSNRDRQAMRERFATFEFIMKDAAASGHARSLNLMLQRVATRYALYWEDDSLLLSKGCWLTMARAVMDSDPSLLSASLDPSIENDARCARRRVWRQLQHPHVHKISVHQELHHYADPRRFVYESHLWPGFSLKPHLLNVELARQRLVGFDESNRDHMEYDFSLRAAIAGLNTAIIAGPVIHDLGSQRSAYVLNDQVRSYDLSFV